MPISRRNFITRTGASISALAFLRALPASAAASFRPGLLPGVDQVFHKLSSAVIRRVSRRLVLTSKSIGWCGRT
jgi:hypothetical protein